MINITADDHKYNDTLLDYRQTFLPSLLHEIKSFKPTEKEREHTQIKKRNTTQIQIQINLKFIELLSFHCIQTHLKPGGTVFWQALSKTLSATGMSRLMPSTFALMAVQRHAATSKSASPSSSGQHLSPEGGDPTTAFTRPRRSAQTPSFNVSRGQNGFGGGTLGAGFGLHVPHPEVKAAERRRNERITTARAAAMVVN